MASTSRHREGAYLDNARIRRNRPTSHKFLGSMQRSVTEGSLTLSGQADQDSKDSHPGLPLAAQESGTPDAGGKSSYFSTYTPYKLNPALTPSLRSSRSKSDRNLRQNTEANRPARQRVAEIALTQNDDTASRSPSGGKAQLLPPGFSSDMGRRALATTAKPTRQPVPPVPAKSDSHDSREVHRIHPEVRASYSNGESSSLHSAKCVSPPSHGDSPVRKIEQAQEWRKVALEAASRSPGGYTSSVVASVTRRRSHQDLRATVSDSGGSGFSRPHTKSNASLHLHRAIPRDAKALPRPELPPPKSQLHALGSSHDTGNSSHETVQPTSSSVEAYRRFNRLVAGQEAPEVRAARATPSVQSKEDVFTPKRDHHTSARISVTGVPTQISQTEPVNGGRRPTRKPEPPTATSLPQPVRSIDDIVREYTRSPQARKAVSGEKPWQKNPTRSQASSAHPLPRFATIDDYNSDDSVDSITREVQRSLMYSSSSCGEEAAPTPPGDSSKQISRNQAAKQRLLHSTSFPSRSSAVESLSSVDDQLYTAEPQSDAASLRSLTPHTTRTILRPTTGSRSVSSRPRVESTASAQSQQTAMSEVIRTLDPSEALVKSPRLTRMVELMRPPNRGLKVSLADVGAADGHPVMVFLGLGAVRYLIGVYEELALALNLRLVCIDRWGCGRTDDVANDRRGLLQWGSVVSEVADELEIVRFSILAHSAGAPYAMATTLLHGDRVTGPVHLLAPWVSPEIGSSYKWLRYVPEPIIRTAQAAEWHVTGWRLGKAANGDTAENANVQTTASTEAVESESFTNTVDSSHIAHASSTVDMPGKLDNLPSRVPVMLPSPLTGHTTTKPLTPASLPKSKPSGTGLSALLGSWIGGTGTSQRIEGAEDPLQGSSEFGNISREAQTSQSLRASVTSRLSTSSPRSSTHGSLVQSPQIPPSPEIPSLASLYPSKYFDTDAVSSHSTDLKMSPPTDRPGKFGTPNAKASAVSSSNRPTSTESESRVERFGLSADVGMDALQRHASGKSQTGSHSGGASARSKVSGGSGRDVHQSTSPTPSLDVKSPVASVDVATTLLRASHNESLRGGNTADLMTILGGRGARPWGFTYMDVQHPVKVWHGERDERIGLASVLWMERECPNVRLKVVKGANHGLMTNTAVVVEALESIAACRSGQHLGRH